MEHFNQANFTLAATHPLSGRFGIKKLLIVAGIILVIIVIIAFTVVKSVYNQLPGDRFYGLKTTTEKVFGGIQLTNSAKIEYSITLLESRLNELNRYALGVSTSTPEQLSKIASESDTTTKDALNMIAGDKSLDAATRINFLTKIDSVVRAEETLGDSIKNFAPITDNVATNEKRANDALRTAVTDFVSQNATGTIEQFIAEKITTLGQSLKSIAPGSSAAKTVADQVNNTEAGVVDHDYKTAIIAIIRAEQAVAIDGYLWNAERGPVEGVPVDNTPVEGN